MYRKLFLRIFLSHHEYRILSSGTSNPVTRCLQYGYNSEYSTHRKHLISRNHGNYSSSHVFQNSSLTLETCVNFSQLRKLQHSVINKPAKSLKVLIKHQQQIEKNERKDQSHCLNNANASHNTQNDAIDPKSLSGSIRGQFVKPIQIPLYDLNCKRTDYHLTYVPILSTLKVMMENEDVQRLCASYPYKNEAQGYFDIFDGEVLKNNDFFRANHDALKIVLFQDSFEASFPICADKVTFKLVGIYMTLANLPPHIRNRKENMKLVLLCFEDFVIAFGWKAVLKKLISDLKILETQGISYSASGQMTEVKGSLIAVTGDNLGSNSIGGFVKNFSFAPYFSRYCENTASELRERTFCTGKLRTVDSYNECVKEAQSTGHVVKGIRMDSSLNDLNHFHVCNPGLPPCCGHDVFEGIAREDLVNSTFYFVRKGWLELNLVNLELKRARLNLKLPLRLPEMREKYVRGHMGSAFQIKLLLMIYPLLFESHIEDHQNDVWRMILKLREVCDLVSSPALTSEQVENLHDKIVEYLTLRVSCFPESPLKAKHLFIQHYPTMTRKFGPLRHLWTSRFEEKHRVMRDLTKQCGSYGDVTDFVATKHEREETYDRDQYSDRAVIEDAVEFQRDDLEEKISLAVPINDVNKFKYMCKKVSFRDVNYEENMCVCVGLDELGNPMICKIEAILVDGEKTDICFVGKKKTIKYNCDTGLYENRDSQVSEKTHNQCYPYSSLISLEPLLESDIDSKTVYITQHTPFGMTF